MKDPESGACLPFVKLTPGAITKTSIGKVIDAGFVTRADICSQTYARLCAEAGI